VKKPEQLGKNQANAKARCCRRLPCFWKMLSIGGTAVNAIGSKENFFFDFIFVNEPIHKALMS
jgi:hypothetical protein